MLLIKNGITVDGAVRDIYIDNGLVVAPGAAYEVIDAAGLVIAPGLCDMHVHFRDPGFTYKEDIISGASAAAAGGVTTALCMPNTSPVTDTPEAVNYIISRAREAAIRVLPYAAVTVGQHGLELTDFAALKEAGAAALSDDGVPIQSAAVMRRALIAAKAVDMLIISHCEDAELVKNFAVNEGAVSAALGIPGRPAIAETLMAARDVMLAADTGARVHIAHVSAESTIEVIRRAKADGIRVTAETCPQYFTLTEAAVYKKGALARVNPPLRTERDRLAVIEALRDGTLDAIATDHAPHSVEEKSCSLESAMSGMVGLETSLALAVTELHMRHGFTLERIFELMSRAPAAILGIDGGTLSIGARADAVIFAPDERFTVEPEKFKSKARNTPFGGMELYGRVKYTISGGKIAYRADMEA